jgi:tetratricopeptide (TPR) repeat protein
MMRVILILAVFFCAPAFADDPAPGGAISVYRAGDWDRAEQVAASGSDASSKALAAQAVLAQLMSGALAERSEHERREAALRAQRHAQAALDLDPDYAPAHLRLAAAFGYEGRYISPLRAALMRLPQRGREHIEQAMALDPDDPWGAAMLGAWHFEVARRGGEGRFGSSLSEGFSHYRAAVAAENVEPSIPYHFALALTALDPIAHRAEIDALLAQAVSDTSSAAFDQTARTLAASLRDLLTQDPAAAQAEAVKRLEQ